MNLATINLSSSWHSLVETTLATLTRAAAGTYRWIAAYSGDQSFF